MKDLEFNKVVKWLILGCKLIGWINFFAIVFLVPFPYNVGLLVYLFFYTVLTVFGTIFAIVSDKKLAADIYSLSRED